MMKDLHSHILLEIDDGSRSIEESLEILKQAEKSGITDIMLTPHYIVNSTFSANNNQKQEKFNSLLEQVRKEKIQINLYLGNEVYIDENILSLINRGEITSLNSSRYILIELPFMNKVQNLKEVIFELVRNGYIPIIAHPERYHFVQKNPEILDEYLEMGALSQGNYQSLWNYYGKSAKKTLKILLKNNRIQFLGSDIHRKTEKLNTKKLSKKLEKIIKDKKKVEDLLEKNFDKVIKNEVVSM